MIIAGLIIAVFCIIKKKLEIFYIHIGVLL